MKLHLSRKAQVDVISTILIIGISAAAVSVAYLWGIPLIDKGQSANQVKNAESTMLLIEGAISEVVRNGGQKSVDLSLEGPLEVSGADNLIIYRFTSKKAGVSTTEWTPMNDDNTYGVMGTPQNETVAVLGTDKSGVLVARTFPDVGGTYATEYHLVYRELDDTGTREGQLVMLAAKGNSKVLSGQHTLTVSRGSPIISATQTSKLGGSLTTTNVWVTLS